MKLIVGLGNPGAKYAQNRHNSGFMLVDYLKQNASFNSDVEYLKPQTFMNKSGDEVSRKVNFYKIKPEDLVVIHDDLDLKLGEYKIQKGKGPKIHNGINHIEERLGTKDFWRVRIGVDARPIENRLPGDAYVLQNFQSGELVKLIELFPEITKAIMALIS